MTSKKSTGLPFDKGVPGAAELLDVERMRSHAQDSYGPFGRVGRMQVRSLQYVPGTSMRVHYSVDIGTNRYDIGAQIGHEIPEKEKIDELKALVKERRTARTPIVRLFDVEAIFSWYPIDLGMPILATSDTHIADLVGMDSAGPTTRTGWLPGERAALRYPEALVKVYRDPANARRAVNAMRFVGAQVPTPKLLYKNQDVGMVGQELLPGKPLNRDEADTSIDSALAILRQLRAIDVSAIPENSTIVNNTPQTLLDRLGRHQALLQFARPDLGDRISTLIDRLTASAPKGLPLVLSHGDFHVGQLMRFDASKVPVLGKRKTTKSAIAAKAALDASAVETTHLIDLDALCLAPQELDLASYALNLMSGRTEDLAMSNALIDRMRTEESVSADALQWYLAALMLCRMEYPIRRFRENWSHRAEVILSSAEKCFA